ncbi:MAG: hypothetical protein VW625_04855 [Perlucidibaca sp.]
MAGRLGRPALIGAALVTGLALLGTGCATSYQDARNPLLSWSGGYWNEPGPGALETVGFFGNGALSREQAGVYLLYHCAELAWHHHKRYFSAYASLDDVVDGRPVADPYVVDTLAGRPYGKVYVLYHSMPVAGALSTVEIIRKYQRQTLE